MSNGNYTWGDIGYATQQPALSCNTGTVGGTWTNPSQYGGSLRYNGSPFDNNQTGILTLNGPGQIEAIDCYPKLDFEPQRLKPKRDVRGLIAYYYNRK
jgi:hypothetical protein